MQAARGASLSDDDTTTSSRPRPSRLKLVFAAVALAAYSVDLVTKHLAVTRLADGDVPVFGQWFVLHLTRNPGAAFSTGTEYTFALSCLAVVAVLVVLWFSRKIADPWWAVGLGLLLGGVSGNLTDRLFRDPSPMLRPRHRPVHAAELAGLQRRRHLHQRSRRRDPAPDLPGHRPRRPARAEGRTGDRGRPPDPVGPRGPRGRARRRRPGAPVRPVPHPRRRPDRRGPRAGRRRHGRQEPPGRGRVGARGEHPRRRPTRSRSSPRSSRGSGSSTTTTPSS